MRIKVRRPAMINGTVGMEEIGLEELSVGFECILAIDGSTTNTGMAIIRSSDGGLVYTMSFRRDYPGESPVEYKVALKQSLVGILKRNPVIHEIYYEEPFVGHLSAVSNIYMLRTFVDEILVENRETLMRVKKYEINNKRWKKMFLAPDKCPTGTELEKEAVKARMLQYMPYMAGVTQDEIDATAMGYVVATKLRQGVTPEELQSTKKARPFAYEVKFIGADDVDEMLECLIDTYNGPKSVIENGAVLIELDNKSDFDKTIYSRMGSDDKLLIISYDSDKHADVTLKFRIGTLAASFDRIYALVWRKTRRK